MFAKVTPPIAIVLYMSGYQHTYYRTLAHLDVVVLCCAGYDAGRLAATKYWRIRHPRGDRDSPLLPVGVPRGLHSWSPGISHFILVTTSHEVINCRVEGFTSIENDGHALQ